MFAGGQLLQSFGAERLKEAGGIAQRFGDAADAGPGRGLIYRDDERRLAGRPDARRGEITPGLAGR